MVRKGVHRFSILAGGEMAVYVTYIYTMSTDKTSDALRFASYNIRKTKGTDRRRDPRRTVAVINDLQADVIALQEVDHRLGDRPAALHSTLIEEETDFRVLPFARNAVSLGWHGNAILVRKDVEVAQIEHLDLPGLEPRGAVSVSLCYPFDLRVIATHLGLMRRHRRKQLRAIMDQVDPDGHTVILGDFNEWSERRGLEPLTDHFVVHSPGRSFHAARPIAGLDRIALSSGLQLRSGGVLQSHDARRASDHLPVWADITRD